MQEPRGGTGGAAGGGGGGGGEQSGQSRPRAAEEQRSSGRSSAGEGRGEGAHEPHGPQDPGVEAAAGNPDQGRPDQQGVDGGQAAAAPQAVQAPLVPAAGADAAGTPPMEFSITVHFQTHQEADIARSYLISQARRRQEPATEQDFTVVDSALSSTWVTEDPDLVIRPINNFLDMLDGVMGFIQHLEFWMAQPG